MREPLTTAYGSSCFSTKAEGRITYPNLPEVPILVSKEMNEVNLNTI